MSSMSRRFCSAAACVALVRRGERRFRTYEHRFRRCLRRPFEGPSQRQDQRTRFPLGVRARPSSAALISSRATTSRSAPGSSAAAGIGMGLHAGRVIDLSREPPADAPGLAADVSSSRSGAPHGISTRHPWRRRDASTDYSHGTRGGAATRPRDLCPRGTVGRRPRRCARRDADVSSPRPRPRRRVWRTDAPPGARERPISKRFRPRAVAAPGCTRPPPGRWPRGTC